MKTYTIDKLKTIAEAGALTHAEVIGVPGGWVVHFTVAMQPAVLREIRKPGARVFTTLDGVSRTLRKMGVRRLTIDMANHTEDSLV